MANNQYFNIYGEAYAEDKDAFIQTFTIRALDDCGDPVYFNMMHTTVCVEKNTFFEQYVLFDDEFFDSGVFAYSIDINGWGDDHGDMVGMIHDLVIEALEKCAGHKFSHELSWQLRDHIEIEETYDRANDEVKHALWHYRKEGKVA